MALNPRNTSALAFMGVLISHGGEWDRGVEIMQRSMELNPHHPGWYHFPRFFDHYRKREFEQALATAKQMNMPEDFWTHAVTAAASGRLGRKEEARAALDALRSLMPGYREELGPTLGLWILDAPVVEQVMEGVAQAEALVGEPPRIAPAPPSPSGAPAPTRGSGSRCCRSSTAGGPGPRGPGRGAVRGDRHRPLALLLPAGDLAQLHVAVRQRDSATCGAVGKEIGRALRHGGQPPAGGRAAARRGAAGRREHRGATCGRRPTTAPSSPDQIFDLQDDLVPRIVSTVGRPLRRPRRAASARPSEEKPLDQLTPYEALMRGFGYHFRLTPEEHADGAGGAGAGRRESAGQRRLLGHAVVGLLAHEHAHGFNPRPGSLDRALAAARRAVDLAPVQPRRAAGPGRRPLLPARTRRPAGAPRSEPSRSTRSTAATRRIFLIAFTGDWERGCSLIRAAMELNPHHPRWYGLILAINAVPRGRLPRRGGRGRRRPTCRSSPWRPPFWPPPTASSARREAAAQRPARRCWPRRPTSPSPPANSSGSGSTRSWSSTSWTACARRVSDPADARAGAAPAPAGRRKRALRSRSRCCRSRT